MKKLDPIGPNDSIANDDYDTRPVLSERKMNHNIISNSASQEVDKNGFTIRHDLNDVGISSFKISQRQDLSRTKSMVNQDLRQQDTKIHNTRSRNFKNDDEN